MWGRRRQRRWWRRWCCCGGGGGDNAFVCEHLPRKSRPALSPPPLSRTPGGGFGGGGGGEVRVGVGWWLVGGVLLELVVGVVLLELVVGVVVGGGRRRRWWHVHMRVRDVSVGVHVGGVSVCACVCPPVCVLTNYSTFPHAAPHARPCECASQVRVCALLCASNR